MSKWVEWETPDGRPCLVNVDAAHAAMDGDDGSFVLLDDCFCAWTRLRGDAAELARNHVTERMILDRDAHPDQPAGEPVAAGPAYHGFGPDEPAVVTP